MKQQYFDDTVMRFLLFPVHCRISAAILVILLLTSCASLPLGEGKEPRTIIVRNRSGVDIATVTLRESVSGQQGSRFGSLSPVPVGVAQVYIRPTNPPPFPRTVAVEWLDNAGRTHMREVSLTKALRNLTGSSDEALVFEIWPDEYVLVFVAIHAK